MKNKIDQIEVWLKETKAKYEGHSIYRNGAAAHELVEENKRLHTEIVTLEKVLEILKY